MYRATAGTGARTIVTAAVVAVCALPALAACDRRSSGRTTAGPSPSPSAAGTGSPTPSTSATGGQGTAAPASSSASKPAGTRGVVDGTNTVFINAYNTSAKTVTLDPIDWFTGQDAVRACAADKEEPGPNDWCTGWYYRNNNKTTVTVPVAASVTIRLVFGADGAVCADPATDPKCRASLDQFPARLKERAPMLAEVGVERQTVVSIREIYTP